MKSVYFLRFRLILVFLIGSITFHSLAYSQTPESQGSATDVAWNPNGSVLAVSGDFGVALYDADFQLSSVFINESTRALAWSPDGTLLATSNYADNAYEVRIWDTQSNQQIAAISMPAGSVWALAWSPSGQHIAAVTYNQGIYIYTVATQSLAFTLTSTSPIVDAAWSPNGTYIAAVGGGATTFPATQAMLNVWMADTGALEFSIDLTEKEQFYAVSAMAWHPDSTKIALGTGFGYIPVLDIASQNISEGYAGTVEPLTFISWSPDGTKFAGADAGTTGSTLNLWDTSILDRTWFLYLTDFDTSYIKGVWKPDSSQLAMLVKTIMNNKTQINVHILDAETGSEIAVLELPPAAIATPTNLPE